MPRVKILRSEFGDWLNNTKIIISNVYNAKLLIRIIVSGKCGWLNKNSHNLSPETIVPQGSVFVNDKKRQFFDIFFTLCYYGLLVRITTVYSINKKGDKL